MAPNVQPWQRLRIAVGSILLFLLTVFGALALVLLAIAPWWAAAAVVVAAAILALPVNLLRRLFTLGRPDWSTRRTYFSSFVVVFLLAAIVVALPVYVFAYFVDARPTLMPLVTLTDGKKTVQFQGMQHVGAESFYKNVVYDLREAQGQGYKLYFEGVQPVAGRPELQQWFDAFATEGKGELSQTYKALAEGCGMQFQLDYFQGLAKDAAAHPDALVTADVDYAAMKDEYDRLMRDDAAFAAAMSAATEPKKARDEFDAFGAFLNFWRAATPQQKQVLGLACRGFFAYAFSQKADAGQRDKLILDFRNTKLAKRIAEAADAKIYVTYGARHVSGVIQDLKAIDPKWQVVSVKWTPAIANPQTRQGELD
jgi:hypothetical protein